MGGDLRCVRGRSLLDQEGEYAGPGRLRARPRRRRQVPLPPALHSIRARRRHFLQSTCEKSTRVGGRDWPTHDASSRIGTKDNSSCRGCLVDCIHRCPTRRATRRWRCSSSTPSECIDPAMPASRPARSTRSTPRTWSPTTSASTSNATLLIPGEPRVGSRGGTGRGRHGALPSPRITLRGWSDSNR